jgi:hypothetical protein
MWCTNDSALEVRLCTSRSCPLWPYRFGRKPTPEVIAEVSALLIYPLEDCQSAAVFFENSGSVLRAIARRCMDCSGGSKTERKNCKRFTCPLHPFRLARNPNRATSPEQRKVKAARLKANIKRARCNDN